MTSLYVFGLYVGFFVAVINIATFSFFNERRSDWPVLIKASFLSFAIAFTILSIYLIGGNT